MSETKHTPIPWSRDNQSTVPNAPLEIMATGTHGGPVAVARMVGKDEEAYANADLLLRAVNCHEGLVHAIHRISAGFCALQVARFGGGGPVFSDQELEDMHQEVMDVLAKAK